MVPRSSRDTICTACKHKKKKCSIKGVVNRLVANGELGSIEETWNLKISSKEDIIALGLDRGSELVMLQLFALRQDVDERLTAIEARLRTIEEWSGREDADEVGSDDQSGCS